MTAPLVTTLPSPPLRSEDSGTFSSKAEAMVAALVAFVPEINALATYLEGITGSAGPITATALTMNTAKILGRTTSAAGAIQEISFLALRDLIAIKGADIASAATIDLGSATGDYVNITGTTTITALGTATAGVERTATFTGALTFTHNATSLILPGAANIATAAGDTAVLRSLGSGNWKCVDYCRASGQAIVSSGAITAQDEGSTLTAAMSSINFVGANVTATNSGGAVTVTIGGAPVSTQSGASYTAVIGDANGYVRFNSASAVAFTLPPNSSVAFPVNTVIAFEQGGAGVVTLTPGSGVTINSRGSALASAGQYAVAQVKKVATDTWTAIGDLA